MKVPVLLYSTCTIIQNILVYLNACLSEHYVGFCIHAQFSQGWSNKVWIEWHKKRRKVVLTADKKMEIFKAVNYGTSYSVIVKKFAIARSMIANTKKDALKLEALKKRTIKYLNHLETISITPSWWSTCEQSMWRSTVQVHVKKTKAVGSIRQNTRMVIISVLSKVFI